MNVNHCFALLFDPMSQLLSSIELSAILKYLNELTQCCIGLSKNWAIKPLKVQIDLTTLVHWWWRRCWCERLCHLCPVLQFFNESTILLFWTIFHSLLVSFVSGKFVQNYIIHWIWKCYKRSNNRIIMWAL